MRHLLTAIGLVSIIGISGGCTTDRVEFVSPTSIVYESPRTGPSDSVYTSHTHKVWVVYRGKTQSRRFSLVAEDISPPDGAKHPPYDPVSGNPKWVEDQDYFYAVPFAIRPDDWLIDHPVIEKWRGRRFRHVDIPHYLPYYRVKEVTDGMSVSTSLMVFDNDVPEAPETVELYLEKYHEGDWGSVLFGNRHHRITIIDDDDCGFVASSKASQFYLTCAGVYRRAVAHPISEGQNDGARGAAYDPAGHEIFNSTGTHLYRRTPYSWLEGGTTTTVGAFGRDDVSALAYDTRNGVLYGATSDSGAPRLIRIDTDTAAIAFVGDKIADFGDTKALAYDAVHNKLYGVLQGESYEKPDPEQNMQTVSSFRADRLFEIDVTTGMGTYVGDIDITMATHRPGDVSGGVNHTYYTTIQGLTFGPENELYAVADQVGHLLTIRTNDAKVTSIENIVVEMNSDTNLSSLTSLTYIEKSSSVRHREQLMSDLLPTLPIPEGKGKTP